MTSGTQFTFDRIWVIGLRGFLRNPRSWIRVSKGHTLLLFRSGILAYFTKVPRTVEWSGDSCCPNPLKSSRSKRKTLVACVHQNITWRDGDNVERWWRKVSAMPLRLRNGANSRVWKVGIPHVLITNLGKF